MEFNFVGLGSNIYEILMESFEKNERNLYFFENKSTYFEIKRENGQKNKNIFNNFKLINEYDFFEKVLETDKIIIKEEKQVVFFYNSLTNKLKKELGIKSYYDCIDIAYNFYNLLAELQEYKIDLTKIKLEEWQKSTFEILLKVNEELDKNSDKFKLALPYMIRKRDNISMRFLKKYNKLILVNKISFTPFERELFNIIETNGIKVENILQLEKEDFDIENMRIKNNISLPTKDKFIKMGINVEIHEYENKLSQLLGMVKKIDGQDEEEKYKIFDGQEITEKTLRDYQLLDQNKIIYNLEITMKNTKIYRVLNNLYELLENIKIKKFKDGENEILFSIGEMYNAFKSREFLQLFRLGKGEYKLFQKLVLDDYKYLSKRLLTKISESGENENFFRYNDKVEIFENLIKFLERLEDIYNLKTLKEYKKVLEEDVKILFENSKIRDKYFEALSEIVVIEDFGFSNLWDNYFNKNISASLLKMFLKYLDKKSISLDLEEIAEQDNGVKYKINNFSTISELNKDKILFLNLQDNFPIIKINNYLFSKIQRKEMGLPLVEDLKVKENFKFINNIFGSKKVYLSYIKNLEENLNCFGLIEEMRLKYDIEIMKNEIMEDLELEFIKNYFYRDLKNFEKKQIGKFIKSKLKKNIKDLREKPLSLSYYTLNKIKDFEYGYYLEKMIGEVEKEEIKNIIEPMFFGNIIHKIYEKIFNLYKKEIENKTFSLNELEIKEILKEILRGYDYKVSKDYLRFYEEISFDEIVKSIGIFFNKFFNGEIIEFDNEDKFKIYSEKTIKEKNEKVFDKYKNVVLNGIMDLYIKSGNFEVLIDFKSGKLEGNNLIKAQEQLDFYSIILGGNMNRGKYIINVWSGEILKDKRLEAKNPKEPLKEKDVEMVLKQYFEGKEYDLGEKNNSFLHKKYEEIARREEELDGE